MGLLDDAIREHLDLKRRHGADPSVVAQEEREALGPARRTAEPAQESGPEAEAPGEEEIVRPAGPDVSDLPDEAGARPGPPPPEEAELPPTGPPAEDTADTDPPLAAAPPPEQAAHPGGAASPEVLEAAGQPADGEDVLDRTPEFLEETPEHDRLWFEQRPPRDFDFDG